MLSDLFLGRVSFEAEHSADSASLSTNLCFLQRDGIKTAKKSDVLRIREPMIIEAGYIWSTC